jgi:hypothetical protein
MQANYECIYRTYKRKNNVVHMYIALRIHNYVINGTVNIFLGHQKSALLLVVPCFLCHFDEEGTARHVVVTPLHEHGNEALLAYSVVHRVLEL